MTTTGSNASGGEDAALELDLGIEPTPPRRGNPASANLANRPWPLQDLLDVAALDMALLARLLHVDHSTVSRRQEWGLTDEESDHWATACGLHPVRVWGFAWAEAVLDQPENMTLFE